MLKARDWLAATLTVVFTALGACSSNQAADEPSADSNGGCTSNAQCGAGNECSGRQCVPFVSCPANPCSSGQTCVMGVCRSACTQDTQCAPLICDAQSGHCQPAPNNGGAPSGGSAGAAGASSAGGGGGNGGASTAGSAGSGGSDLVPAECSTDMNLVKHGGWVGCDPDLNTDDPQGLQGSIYMYDDGASCAGSPLEPCGAEGCCIAGSTATDPTFAKWGCGLGFELSSTGGVTPMKRIYSGAAKCFDIALTGNSGGNEVRIAYTQAADMSGKVAPFLPIKSIAGSWEGTVCLDDVICPNWMPKPDCALGGPYDLQIQVVGGARTAAFDLCLTELVPHDGTGAGLNALGQVCGIVGQDANEHINAGKYRIQNNVFMAGSGNQCITAKAGGGAAAFTVDSSTLGTGGNSPVAYPSIVYGWHFGAVTPGTGLPKALSAITSAPTTVAYTVPAGGKYNAAFDIWAMPPSAGNNPTTPGSGVEIMIWLAAAGGATPLGSPGETVTIGNNEYQIWQGTNSTWQVVTFWAKSFVPALTNHDLKPFFDRVVSLGKAQADWNLHSIQFGFEVWNSAPGFAVTNFSQTVN
jgi:hypothetical protein